MHNEIHKIIIDTINDFNKDLSEISREVLKKIKKIL